MKIYLQRTFLFSIFLIYALLPASAQVSADFSANITSGCGPLIVSFDNLSSGSGSLTYNWDFGNGNSSTAEEPSATYINPGQYTVTLTVSNGTDSDTEVKTDYIIVFQEPDPDFSASTNEGCFPLEVDFTDLSTLGSAPISSWIWDFGDGSISTDTNPTHIYTDVGEYNVTLLLIDTNGCQQDVTFNDFITVTDNFPTVDFTADPTFSCNPPEDVSFSNSSSGDGPLTYSWNFGDGSSSTQNEPVNTYSNSGLYTVTLVATDPNGCADSLVRSDYINIVDSVIINFTVNDTGICVGQAVQFTDLSDPAPTSWLWDFGDGNTSTDQNPTHTYNQQGDFTVSLTASYEGSCTETTIITNYVTVSDIPDVSFTADETYSCETPFTVNFTNTSSGTGTFTYLWDFGDGNTSSDENPTHIYSDHGDYTVSLTLTNSQGCSVTDSAVDYIDIAETTADFSPDVFGFCNPLTVNFTDESTAETPIVSWNWSFGDGGTSTDQNPTHTYTQNGQYTVTLIIENQEGCQDTLVRPNLIFVSEPPNTDFSATPLEVCAGSDVNFTDLSTNATDYSWSFGDGEFSTEQNPVHQYADTGYYTVTLIALNDGCADTLVIPNYIHVIGSNAAFSYAVDCENPLTVNFEGESGNAESWFWDFGDGNTSTQENPVHTFDSTGTYEVILTVESNGGQCSNGATEEIILVDPVADFSVDTTSGCSPLTVNFTDESEDASSWFWDFGDGNTSTDQNPSNTYYWPQEYNVTLTITDINGCEDTTTANGLINTIGAVPGFTIDSSPTCDSIVVNFTDTTTPPGATTWLWEFGDGDSATVQNPTHVYETPGTYDVTLSITDNVGCSNSLTQPAAVTFDPYPEPDFSASVTSGCPGLEVDFSNQSSGNITSYLWDFGDGNTSSDENPTHIFQNAGLYTVSLTVSNSLGCDTTLTFDDYIQVEAPVADFSAFPTEAFCPPLVVDFTDLSQGNIVSWQWDFGDSTSSTQQNPSHIYTEPGQFDVQLVVTNDFGCTDTLFVDDVVNLSGPVGTFSFMPDSAGCPPFEVEFEAQSPNATEYTWDFGDGSLGSGPTVTHTYTELGQYLPVLILEDANGCNFTIQSEDSIYVQPLQVDAGSDITICREDTVTLTASGGDTYQWSPATALSHPDSSTTLAYPETTTTYVVDVEFGQCFNSDTMTITVANTPFAGFAATEVCQGDSTVFNDQSTVSGDTLEQWNWDFGDGNTSNDTNPNHLYSAGGTYEVSLTVSSMNGCSNTFEDSVIVHSVPDAQFSVDEVCLGDTNVFIDQSSIATGNIQDWTWNFGDGDISFQQNPDHLYTEADTFNIELTVVGNGGCSDTTDQSIIVHPNPVADFVGENVCLGDTTFFADSSTIASENIAQWDWDFGDNSSSTDQNPFHVYGQDSTYPVSLTVTSGFGCSDSTEGSVTVYPLPVASFETASDSACDYPVTVNMINNSSGAVSYSWDFGNGDSSGFTNPLTTYDTVGAYPITLNVTNQFGCVDAVTQVFNVYPIPQADFNLEATEGCQPLTVQFNDLSENATIYQWEFGDGGSSNESEPVYTYQDDGTYDVTLIIEGAGGCVDTITNNDIIEVWPVPTADFDYEIPANPLIDGTVHFTNTSSPIVSIDWDFGDGATSTEMNPTHQYSHYGDKPVTLIVTDFRGCMDTINTFIHVDFFNGLHVPNAFIPNHPDEEVAQFLPKGTGLASYRLMIFDTYGNLIWETTKLENGQPAEGWNGMHEGELLPQNAYVWFIHARFDDGAVWQGKEYPNGKVRRTGTVTLLR